VCESETHMESSCFEVEPNRNAEAYRNYQPAVLPAQIEKYMDFIEFCGGKYRTNRVWFQWESSLKLLLPYSVFRLLFDRIVHISCRRQYPYEIQYVGITPGSKWFQISSFYVSLTELYSGEIQDTGTVSPSDRKLTGVETSVLWGLS